MPRRNAIVFLIDGNIFPAAVFQAFRLAAFNRRTDTDVCIVTDAKDDIVAAEAFGAPCRFVYLDPALVGRAMKPGYPTRVTYYRALFPELLAADYRRILQIDTDTAIEDDRLFALFDLDLRGFPIAGVRDPMVAYRTNPGNVAELRWALRTAGKKYLNNGLTLIDPDRFTGLNLGAASLDVIEKVPGLLMYANQTAINVVLDGNWLELSPAFNMMVPLWKSFAREACRPSIVHFAGPAKPWHGRNFAEKHPIRAELERFVADSPWPDFVRGFEEREDEARRNAGPAAPPGPAGLLSIEERKAFDMAGFVDYLTTTPFADVEAGLSVLDIANIPERLRSLA